MPNLLKLANEFEKFAVNKEERLLRMKQEIIKIKKLADLVYQRYLKHSGYLSSRILTKVLFDMDLDYSMTMHQLELARENLEDAASESIFTSTVNIDKE